MTVVPLSSLTEPVQTWNPSREPEREFTYIDLSAVDNAEKKITGAAQILGSEAPSRARQLVSNGDVLVSTVRPNLNAVATVPPALDGSTASTGFTVLRPGAKLDGRYLFQWVRSLAFVSDMVSKATGASYPAVSDRIVRESLILFRPLEEQRRIAAILDRADAIRAKRRQVLAHLDSLVHSIFNEMFGDPDGYAAVVPFGEIAHLSGGRNLVADDSKASSTFRVLKISAVTTGTFRPEESKPLPPAYTPPRDHLVRGGDLLMSRANTTELVGAVAMVNKTPPNLALPDKVWRFNWKVEADPRFYQTLLSTPQIRRRISRLSSGTGGSMKNISKAKLETMPIPGIPYCDQRKFAGRAEAILAHRGLTLERLAADDELFASLQSRAFRGEL